MLFAANPFAVHAGINPLEFDSPAEEQRFKTLASEIRCLVCQNQSLADSNAELAGDLRAEVYRLMKQGNSDKQILDFLVTRYSDFVLYRPRVKTSTLLLWFGPFLLLVIAFSTLMVSVKRKSRQASAEVSEGDHERVSKLLDNNNTGDHHS